MKKLFFSALAVTALASSAAQASSCAALADFFGKVVKASQAEYKSDRLKEQIARIRKADDACTEAISRMSETEVYTHRIGAPLTALQDYLVDDARFAVRVIGGGDKIETIEFDVDAVGVLRRRPTR